MNEQKFLPQYAAQAVIDLEFVAKRCKTRGDTRYYATACQGVAALIRNAVHVVLPENGEIYRPNGIGSGCPSEDESISLGGLPAPVTCFEYPWSRREGIKLGVEQLAPRRITLVVDGKQFTEEFPGVVFISVFYSEGLKLWGIADTELTLTSPVKFIQQGSQWGAEAMLRSSVDGYPIKDEAKIGHAFQQFQPDIISVVQCCHALRAGARLDEQTEPSATRRWKFSKKGVGGFTYHVLKLPDKAGGDAHAGGSHASPRFHVRRAHIRKLPTGALTFVRQCFVGDRERGVVEKHYAVSA